MDIVQQFEEIRVSSLAGKPALHKPLLLLIALGRCASGEERLAAFAHYDELLSRLFAEVYPDGQKNGNTHYPFGKLENDGLWYIENSDLLKRTSAGHLHKRELIDKKIKGGFTNQIWIRLSSDQELLVSVVSRILRRFFSEDVDDSLLNLCGFPKDFIIEYGRANETRGSSFFAEELTALWRSKEAKGVQNMNENQFVAYLNSLHNVGAAGANALAESQALNQYFGELYQPFNVVDDVVTALTDKRSTVVVLTGHAGDGKSTVALDVLKKLRGLPDRQPLDKPLDEREVIDGTPNASRTVTIVKDMSELSAERRLQWLEEAFSGQGSWLIVSNTGPLLNSLHLYAEHRGIGSIRSKILEQLNLPYVDGQVDAHRLPEFPKDLVIINMTRLDNVTGGAGVLTRMIYHSGWEDCVGCPIENACPLLLNRNALATTEGVAEERVRWIYRRLTAYEQRLTFRQMVAHLAYSITGGMNCTQAKESVAASTGEGSERGTDGLEHILFSEAFFGYQKGHPAEDAGRLRAVELVRRAVFGGPVGADFARELGKGQGNSWADLPVFIDLLSRRWADRAGESAGVRWRFAQRRLFYLFGRAKYDKREEACIFIDGFLQSPWLRSFDHWTRECSLKMHAIDKKRLRNACLRVLLETYSGFSAGQFSNDQDRLYLTLRRPDRAVVQPTQLVMAEAYFKDFNLDYDPAIRMPMLKFSQGSVSLPLTLPLLDYIEKRHEGNLGDELAEIHMAQLEWFRAELSSATSVHSDQSDFALLRANIDGQVKVHRYMVDWENNRLEIDS